MLPRHLAFSPLLLAGCSLAALVSVLQVRGEEPPDFDRAVAPLLARRCLDCHSGDEPKGKLDLSRRDTATAGGESGAAIVAGKPDDSLLWHRIVDGEMPPKKPLPEAERAVLKAWIAGGAKWGTEKIDPFRFTTAARAGYDWWSLQPVKRPAVPASPERQRQEESPGKHGLIDDFIQARLVAAGLTPSPPADRRVLIRRVTIDLLGLPPAPEEIDAFVADPRPDAYERLVDRLLASPHYGERWARHWLDVARFGESQGFERDKLRPNSWRYRDWVVEALNRDLPYGEFIRLQLAGDLLRPNDPGAIAATGFLVAGPWDEVGKGQQSAAMKAVVRQDELEDYVSVVGQTFLGLTVNCARCHDHKFDPIRQAEYYRLAASLAGVEHGTRALPADELRPRAARAVAALRREREDLAARIDARTRATRERLLAERRERMKNLKPPEPFAEWIFDTDARDQRGALHGELKGGAKIADGRLVLNGKDAYVQTAPLDKEITARTLVVWAQLANLDQRGGGAMTVQTLDGNAFDSIVFAEKEPRRWMAGSEFYNRYQTFTGPDETEADKGLVQIAIVYHANGIITPYRNGRLYGTEYRANRPDPFRKGAAQVVFGQRHVTEGPAGPGRLLAGTIDRAMLFDRALAPEEVASLAKIENDSVPESELLAQLTPADRAEREAAKFELTHIEDQIRRQEEFHTYAVAPKAPHKVHLLARGEPGRAGAEVTPGGIASLVGLEPEFRLPPNADDAARRKALAEWITDPQNPLTPRVIVNRLWHYHFGVGLVETPNDFGFNGGRPTHPELLDWLAAELLDRGGSLKHIHRLIVTSGTYRQSSLPRADAQAKDADNRLLWRKSPQRLDAETLRDAMLVAAGELNPAAGGPGYTDFRTFTFNSQFYEVFDAVGASFQRRSLYRTAIRSGRSPLLDAFDCPDPSTKSPTRAVTTTPLQALSLLNNSFSLRMSDRVAERATRAADSFNPEPTATALRDRQVTALYRHILGREPFEAERLRTAAFAHKHGLPALARVLFNTSEFLYVD